MKRKKIKRFKRAMKVSKSVTFSYKKVDVLFRFVNEQGSILSREESGLTQKQQRSLATAVKRARHLALLPFTQVL
ncbi:30S ribosomal protein S18 [Candidatus Woesebacteria bacterium]|jgi:small subunit ribosomal protein S18|nr:30S ribosomal protein S18 [Candidatus Woesebacteria bacterium]